MISIINLILFNRIFDCDTCKADIQAYIDIMASEKSAMDITTQLKGPIFCQDPSLGLSEEQVAGCQTFVEAFMPVALKSFFVDDEPSAEEICQVYFDQCTAKRYWWQK